MSKPDDFMLGVLEFFAVLLPGAVATYLVSQYLPPQMRTALYVQGGEHSSATPWIVYLLTSYALGHFVFLIGSRLDPLYDRWRRRAKPLDHDGAYKEACNVREAVTPGFVGKGFSAFKWARCYVGVLTPHARVEIDRLEGSSKFFRGMVVVSMAAAGHFLVSGNAPALSASSVVIGVLSFWRFCDQRWKMTELTYATAVIVHSTGTKATHAAGKGQSADDKR